MCVCVCAPFVCLQCICVCAHMFMRVQLVPLSFGLDIKGNAHTDGRHIWAAIPNSTIKLIELLILLCLFLSLSACPSELDSGRCVAACLTCIHPCLPATTSPYLLSPAVCLLLLSLSSEHLLLLAIQMQACFFILKSYSISAARVSAPLHCIDL